MAAVKYLDENGLSTVWSKVKGIVTPKADKVSSATNGNLAGLNASGNLTDSGLAATNVAQKDGSYSGMTVGAAEDLVSAESVASEFTSRITGGSTAVGKGGTALVDKIKGRTLVWNQLVQKTWFPTSSGSGLTLTNNGDGTYTINGTSESNYRFYAYTGRTSWSDHKYYCALSDSNLKMYFDGYPSNAGNALQKQIITTNASSTYFPILYFPSGSSYSNLRFTVIIIDLTLMFGAGSEPATPEEFEALYPGPFYDNNNGTLISNAATAIETVGWNLYDPATGKARVIGGKQYHVGGTYTSLSKDGATITPDASGLFTPDTSGEVTVAGGTSTDTIISLSDASRNGTYEPYWRSELELNIPTLTGKLNGAGNSVVIFQDGLRSAGTVFDEIVGNKAIKRIGSVDMGTLSYSAGYGGFYTVSLKNLANFTYASTTQRILSARYEWKTYNQGFGSDSNCMFSATDGNIIILDSGYSSAQDFKAAMSGVPLYYELATPEEYILDEAIPTAMRNDPYGTERRLPEDTAAIVTAPFRADITYSTNIKEAVQSMHQNFINVNSMQDFLAALGAQMGGTWTMRPADGKFDFTFTPNPSNE